MTKLPKLNVMQLPKVQSVLEAFVPPAGHTLVELDFASVEPMIAATFSRDPTLLELYASGRSHDVYLFVMAKVDPDHTVRDLYCLDNPTAESVAAAKRAAGKMRGVYKQVHLSAQYGAGAYKIWSSLMIAGVDISLEQVQDAHRAYWKLFAGLRKWENRLLAEREDRGGWIVNGRGLPLCIPDHRTKDITNAFCQSTGHDLLLTFVWHINRLRLERDVPMTPWLVDLHDETVWSVPDSHVTQASAVLRDALSLLNSELGSDILIKGEVETGRSLWEFKK